MAGRLDLSRWGSPLLLAAAAALPLAVPSPFFHELLIQALLYAYLALAWNLLSGYAGQFSFGHAAFYGLGAYTSTLLFMKAGVSPWLGMLAGAALAALAGAGIGYVSFRYGLRGAHFALVTFAFAGMLQVIATNWQWVGASVGLLIPLKGNAPHLFQFRDRLPYYYIALAMVAGAIWLTRRLVASRVGFYFRAIREEEVAAATCGIPTLRYKVLAMAISAAMTALGGTFYAQYQYYLDPHIAFGPQVSVAILLGAVVGGVGTVAGPVLGACLIMLFSEGARTLFRSYPGLHLTLYGAILMAVVLFLPQGFLSLVERWRVPGTPAGRAKAKEGAPWRS